MADTRSKTFTENVNHVAELDNSLGYELVLRRSNIVLNENVTYAATTEIRLFNRATNMTENISVPSASVTAGGLNIYLGQVKTALELAYPECVMTHSVTQTVSALGTFNNAHLSVVLSGGDYYLRSINIKISESDGIQYDIDSELVSPLEITPSLVSLNAESLANINAVAANATNINAVAANEANIDIVSSDKANIDAVAANKVNIDAVAANESNINAVIGSAAATAADVLLTHADVLLTHADVVLTNADAVSAEASAAVAITQAGIATTKAGESLASADAANASKISAASSELNASLSASSAELSATTATTKAGEASVSAINAATSESNAGLSEANALASANTAAMQAGIATTKAGEASASAIASAASAALAEAALDDITGLTASATTLVAGASATASYDSGTGMLYIGVPQGMPGEAGAPGIGISSIIRTTGDGSAGTTDTYTITYTDATTSTFVVYNGADGSGSGDMLKSVYDTTDNGIVDAAESAPWSGITDKPSVYPPDVHNHDDLYFTEVETLSLVNGLIDDTVPTTTKVYSSIKTQELHNAQAVAIANLSGASASFSSSISQSVPESPTAFLDLEWTNDQISSNSSIFELGTNEINFYKDGNYSFLNTLTFYRLNDGSVMDVTFELYDADTATVLATFVQPIDMTAGTKETVPMNAVLEISGATAVNPVRMKVRMQGTSANGTLELFSFSSILVAQSIISVADLETDPVFTAWDRSTGISITKSQVSDFPTLATVATSGSYTDLSDKPTIPVEYSLPTASGTILGGVKVGANLTITDGVLSADAQSLIVDSAPTDGSSNAVSSSGVFDALNYKADKATTYTKTEVDALMGPSFAVGDIVKTVVGRSAPAWLACNGNYYNDIAYPDLATVIPKLPSTAYKTIGLVATYTCGVSPDNTYFAIGLSSTPFIKVYKRTGTTFSALSALTAMGNWTKNIRWDNSSIYMAAAVGGGQANIYKRSGDSFSVIHSIINVYSCAWARNDNTVLGVTTSVSPYVSILKRTGDSFVAMTNTSSLATSGSGIGISPDGTIVATIGSNSNQLKLYSVSGTTVSNLMELTLPFAASSTAYIHNPKFSTDGTYIAITPASDKSGVIVVKTADWSILPSQTLDAICITKTEPEWLSDDTFIVNADSALRTYKVSDAGLILIHMTQTNCTSSTVTISATEDWIMVPESTSVIWSTDRLLPNIGGYINTGVTA